MQDIKGTKFEDRLSNQAEAKKALLAKLKPKPTVRPDEFVDSRTLRERELEAVRVKRAEERETQRQVQLAARAAEEAAKKSERKVRKALTKAEQQQKREASRAARMMSRTGMSFSSSDDLG